MKVFKLIFIVIFSMSSLACQSQDSGTRIEIVSPNIEQEANSIWRTIRDIRFFEKQGYTIHLPKHSLMDSLIMKSKNGTFGNEDFQAIYALLENNVFQQSDYEEAIQKVKDQVERMDNIISEIASKKSGWNWDFKMFEKYRIVFTLYGTGGSYDPDEGIITLLTNKEGGFMNYKNPVNTIIHEITHIGMEYSIVQKYGLSHGLKERIVDTFVSLMFRESLPEYKIQKMGDTRIDRYFNEKEDIDSLSRIVSEFVLK